MAWQNLWSRQWSPRPDSVQTLSLTAGQMARWFIEANKADFEDADSPLYGMSTTLWQDIMIFMQHGEKPSAKVLDEVESQNAVLLRRQLVDIFEADWLRKFRIV